MVVNSSKVLSDRSDRQDLALFNAVGSKSSTVWKTTPLPLTAPRGNRFVSDFQV